MTKNLPCTARESRHAWHNSVLHCNKDSVFDVIYMHCQAAQKRKTLFLNDRLFASPACHNLLCPVPGTITDFEKLCRKIRWFRYSKLPVNGWYARQLSVALRKGHRINSITRKGTVNSSNSLARTTDIDSDCSFFCFAQSPFGKRFAFSPPSSRAKGVLVIRATVATVIYGQFPLESGTHLLAWVRPGCCVRMCLATRNWI